VHTPREAPRRRTARLQRKSGLPAEDWLAWAHAPEASPGRTCHVPRVGGAHSSGLPPGSFPAQVRLPCPRASVARSPAETRMSVSLGGRSLRSRAGRRVSLLPCGRQWNVQGRRPVWKRAQTLRRRSWRRNTSQRLRRGKGWPSQRRACTSRPSGDTQCKTWSVPQEPFCAGGT